jgi:prepilin-type N-terminal cleavage/methylation domain-containing protein
MRRRSSRGLFRSAGFTLLEIVVVLALCGLISALLIVGTRGMLQAVAQDDVENTALRAVARIRNDAVLSRSVMALHLDEKVHSLEWDTGHEALVGEDRVRLLPPGKLSAVLIGGRVEEAPLVRVRFYPDGTCDPFRLEVIRGTTSRILPVDPWTCLVLSSDAPIGAR